VRERERERRGLKQRQKRGKACHAELIIDNCVRVICICRDGDSMYISEREREAD
jgi:hypothetical protein